MTTATDADHVVWAKYMGRSGLASAARRVPAHAETAAVPRLPHWAALLGAALLLAGCGERSNINPLQWWRELQGGAIAQQRPPPPNADAPYPNLGSVPPKPEMPDPAARQRIASALAADRANAQYEATLAPLPNVPHTRNPPGLFATPSMPASKDESAASASLDAANAPPAPVTGPAKPAAAKPSAAAPRPGAPPALPSASPEPAGPPPVIPAAPPPLPHLQGFAIPVSKPTPPSVAPLSPPQLAPLAAAATTPLPIGFPANSAVLPSPAETALRDLARRRGGHNVEVVGFGDVTDATPQVQAAGVDLALARARAIVAALNADGVPPSAIRMSAQAEGRGGAARLVD